MVSSYFVDTMQLHSNTFDEWGEATVTISTVPCYIDWKTRTMRDAKGIDVIAAARILCEDQDISYDDKIKIGDLEHSIIQINQKMAFNYPHMEIFVQ